MEAPITIVAGLPRSGTSMMMRMLEAGGMQPATDHVRQADEDNPRGYYELERVKEIRSDSAWLDGLRGKVVKMVSMLLLDLPADHRYKIIFMKRKMQEILASQRIMLDRRGEAARDEREMAGLYEKHLGEVEVWLREQRNIEVLFVNYNELLRDPRSIVPLINRFFDDRLNEAAMTAVVDPSLYRQRNAGDDAPPAAEQGPDPQDDGDSEKEKIEEQLRSLGYM